MSNIYLKVTIETFSKRGFSDLSPDQFLGGTNSHTDVIEF